MKTHYKIILAVWLLLQGMMSGSRAGTVEESFQSPPASARPWVYWFWNNGNVTSNGITADLEAMHRVGIGGVLIMDVVERFAPPRGPADFMSPLWRDLFQFAVQEAGRLGMEINMDNGPGWTGSSGPWMTPALSMQKLVWTNVWVEGPTELTVRLPHPAPPQQRRDLLDSKIQVGDYYEDIAVLAFPVTTNGVIARDEVVDLSARLGSDGTLSWSVPPGRWQIQRLGHESTGSSTRPPVAGGNGLECDKLSAVAMDWQFTNMMVPLLERAGALAGRALVATHIDSWEVGGQDWTPAMRAEFQRRRGYDPLPWLPTLTDGRPAKAAGHVVDDRAMTERFRWDFAETRAELLAENYSGRIAERAHEHGLRFTLEGYDLPFGDEFTYTARADEPMTEFWTRGRFGQGVTYRKVSEMASVGHVYGRPVVGAESFTSDDHELWKLTPAAIKSLGDYEFSQGVNRFVIHRYAHQPYTNRAPGATMGPWGLHYERTETWWELSPAWHDYVACCCYLLRQGKFVADLLYLRPERPDQTYFNPDPGLPAGYRFDEISAEALMERVTVQDGRLELPDGMSYRLLVLPPEPTMTPALAQKVRDLVAAGAQVFVSETRPTRSPSLSDYPHCDAVVDGLTREIWGDSSGGHDLGQGKVYRGQALTEVLQELGAGPDLVTGAKVYWMHRRSAELGDFYFVANPEQVGVSVAAQYRVHGRRPEQWNPETGQITRLAEWTDTAAGTTVPLWLGPGESCFVVFREAATGLDPVVKFTRNGQPVDEMTTTPLQVKIVRATYGVPGDAARTRDVTRQVQQLVDDGARELVVGDLAKSGDPAYGVVKTCEIDCVIGSQRRHISGEDTDTVNLVPTLAGPEPAAQLVSEASGQVKLRARRAGEYAWTLASGSVHQEKVEAVPAEVSVPGPWQLTFPPHLGAPESVSLTNLISWTESPDEGVKYFSGMASYHTKFRWSRPAEGTRVYLDLGEVHELARVRLNGQSLGILWKAPYRVEVSDALQDGENQLEIEVANLWPNRMIGDAARPEAERLTWSSFEPFKPTDKLLVSGLLGPVRLRTEVER